MGQGGLWREERRDKIDTAVIGVTGGMPAGSVKGVFRWGREAGISGEGRAMWLMRGGSGRGRRKIKRDKRGKVRSERDKVRNEGGEEGKARENNNDLITTIIRDKRKKRLRKNIIRKVKIRRIKTVTKTGEGEISELCLI
jgi:hypothetical protein